MIDLFTAQLTSLSNDRLYSAIVDFAAAQPNESNRHDFKLIWTNDALKDAAAFALAGVAHSPPTPTRHFERSRPTFSSAFAPANASACGCEKSLFLFRPLAQRDRFLSAVCMEKSVFFILESAGGRGNSRAP